MDRIVFSAALAAGVALAATIAAAQQYPTRPVKMIVPFSPGSGVDVPARIAAEKLSQALGQSFVVENRTGAGGTIASAFVASAAPDGYTLLVNSSAHTLYPSLYNSLSFDPAKDLVPVVTIAEVPLLMVVSPEKGWRSLKDLVAYAKANPGALTYGSAGVATTTHVSFERLRASAQFTGVHVPFKGTPEAITEVIAGRIDVTYTTVFAATPGIRSNKLVPIALAGRKHSALLPDVPTSVEAGFPDSDYTVWVGILAPAQTPRPIMARLSDEMMKALATAETGERIAKAGLEPLALPIEQFQAATRAEFASNQVLVKAAGIKPQ
jgi:tripartite-type tricarboxylate transporter receptor subunit TctC